MRDQFLIFGSPIIEQPEIDEVVAVMQSGWLGTGPRVGQFEREFAAFKDANYAAAVNSCTAALHLSLLAAGIEPGDEVITTPMTFCATINAIIHAGGTPVLVDIDPTTMNIDPERIEEKISSRTKVILPVHFAGSPCDMDRICAIAQEYKLKVIEDCAHSVEAQYRGQHVGTIGDFGCFSFYVTKNIVTGEGGMVLAKSERDAERIKSLSLHGMSQDAYKRFGSDGYKHYQVVEAGFKYNMTDMQAAIGVHQLRRIEAYWGRRREIWNQYQEAFKTLPIQLPAQPDSQIRHAYHLHTVLINENEAGMSRDVFINTLTKNNIGVGVHYLSIPEHPYYCDKFGWRPEEYPHAMRLGRQTVSLPLSAKLTAQDVDDVISAVTSILS